MQCVLCECVLCFFHFHTEHSKARFAANSRERKSATQMCCLLQDWSKKNSCKLSSFNHLIHSSTSFFFSSDILFSANFWIWKTVELRIVRLNLIRKFISKSSPFLKNNFKFSDFVLQNCWRKPKFLIFTTNYWCSWIQFRLYFRH